MPNGQGRMTTRNSFECAWAIRCYFVTVSLHNGLRGRGTETLN